MPVLFYGPFGPEGRKAVRDDISTNSSVEVCLALSFFRPRSGRIGRVAAGGRVGCIFCDFREFLTKIEFGVCFNILKYIKAHSKPKMRENP